MTFISTRIQKGYLRRIGFRGRWLTVYWHRYGGRPEKSERFHQHPWEWVVSVVLRGYLWDATPVQPDPPFSRRMGSVAVYRRGQEHRIRSAGKGTMSLFVGWNRTQESIPNATVKCREGYCHYTELSGHIDEPRPAEES